MVVKVNSVAACLWRRLKLSDTRKSVKELVSPEASVQIMDGTKSVEELRSLVMERPPSSLRKNLDQEN